MALIKFIWVLLYLVGAYLDYQTHTFSYLDSLIAVFPAFIVGLVPAALVYFFFMKGKWTWYHVLNLGAGIMVVWVMITI